MENRAKRPKYVTLGAHYSCNARCRFCLGGDYPDFSMKIYRNLFESKLMDVFRGAEHIGYCGFGEILLHPEITEFLGHINRTLPDTQKVFTTNGTPLSREICDIMAGGRYSVLISLHASSRDLHKSIFRIDAYDKITDNVRYLVELKRKVNSTLHTNLIFIISEFNISDMPSFVERAAELGVDCVTANYLTIFEKEHLDMSCFFRQDKALECFEKARVRAEELGVELNLPPKFGEYDSGEETPPCRDPWEFFYVEVQGSVLPCCNAGGHIGYLNKTDFDDIWNGAGYEALRQALISGEPHEWCRYCVKFRKSNVNDIRGHITARPETQKMILDYLAENRERYPGMQEGI